MTTSRPATSGPLGALATDKSWFDVRRQWWLVLGCVVCGVSVSWIYTSRATPLYQSSAQVLLYGRSVPRPASSPAPSAGSDAVEALSQSAGLSRVKIRTYAELTMSNQVMVPVMKGARIEGTAEELRQQTQVVPDANSGTLTISVRDSDPSRAARAAAGIARTAIEVIGDLERQDGGETLVRGLTLRDAEVATQPFWPRLDLNLAVGLMAGLVVGVGLATMRDQLDTRIRGERQLFDAALTWPLACVPTASAGARGLHRTQALSRIALALGYGSPAGGPRILLLTAPRSDPEKTELARDLAALVSRMGMTVLLVDCDLRSSLLTRAEDRVDSAGLSEALAKLAPADSLIQGSVGGPDVLGAGRRSPNPTELLASRSMAELLAQWRSAYDLVLLDAAPALGVADAFTVISHCDGVLCVVRDGVTRRHDLAEAIRLLGGAHGRPVGLALIGRGSPRTGQSIDLTHPTARRRSRT